MHFDRWAQESGREISTSEMHETLDCHREEGLLFAFTTDRLEVAEHSGPFSVKLVTRGCERYLLDKRSIRLEPGHVLVVNAGQRYASSIEQRATCSTSFFLPPSLVREAEASISRDEIGLLDSPASLAPVPEVPQAPFRPSPSLTRAAGRLTGAVRSHRPPSREHLEEMVMETAARALGDALGLARPEALAGCTRRSTRDELVARVLRARDLVHDTGGRTTLARMAEIACLSRFHFLRVFREVFGVTPATYARGVRLRSGRQRLARGAPAREAARAAGFSSSSTFLRALRSGERLPR